MGLTGITGTVVEYALDGLALRHTAIAANIANANTPGYRPLQVSFEGQLASVAAQINNGGGGDVPLSSLPAPQVATMPPIAQGQGRQVLEGEIINLNRNVMQYQALIRGLDKYTAMLSTAINEGRR